MAKNIRTVANDGPHPITLHVAARLKLRRHLVGLSQEDLGKALGVSFQQVQKYENGGNRMSAPMLAMAASALGVPVAFFFEGLPADVLPAGQPPAGAGLSNSDLQLVNDWHRLSPDQQAAINGIIHMAKGTMRVAPAVAAE